ncbi:MAG: hypothetical protein GY940_27910 [bacterium]|nr:hypothetical protein [bacterium]
MNTKKESQDIQQQYKELISQRRFAELAKLMKSSDTPPADYNIRTGFKAYIEEPQGKKVKLFYIMKLKEITQIKPDTSILRAACEISLDANSPEVLESVVKRLEIEKEVFKGMEAFLQKTYASYVENGRFVDISKLMEITSINPLEDMIHKGYQSYLEECKFISFSGLKKRTDIPPNEVMIQEIYQKYQEQYLLNQNKNDEEAMDTWFNRIKKLKRISKIRPKDLMIDLEQEQPPQDTDLPSP